MVEQQDPAMHADRHDSGTAAARQRHGSGTAASGEGGYFRGPATKSLRISSKN
jgi:hypothetical protein